MFRLLAPVLPTAADGSGERKVIGPVIAGDSVRGIRIRVL